MTRNEEIDAAIREYEQAIGARDMIGSPGIKDWTVNVRYQAARSALKALLTPEAAPAITPEMVERAAVAMWRRMHPNTPWERSYSKYQDDYRLKALAVLEDLFPPRTGEGDAR